MSKLKCPLKVFLCHAHNDKSKARELYRYLRKRGIQPWLDAANLLPGEDWRVEIPKAIKASDAIIICLSKNSVDKEGYVQNEIKFSLDKALGMPEGRIFLIPARLEECEVPSSLKRYQWVDLFDESGYPRLMKSLKVRASQLERATVQVSKQDEGSSYLAEKPKYESHDGVTVHVNENIQGNIIIGNKNAVQSQTARHVEPSDKKEAEVQHVSGPEKPVDPTLGEQSKNPLPWRAMIMVALILIGAAVTIVALIGFSLQYFKLAPIVAPATRTATITAVLPSSRTPEASFASAETPTFFSTKTVIVLDFCDKPKADPNFCILSTYYKTEKNDKLNIHLRLVSKTVESQVFSLIRGVQKYPCTQIPGYDDRYVCPEVMAEKIYEKVLIQILSSDSSWPLAQGDIVLAEKLSFPPTFTPKPKEVPTYTNPYPIYYSPGDNVDGGIFLITIFFGTLVFMVSAYIIKFLAHVFSV